MINELGHYFLIGFTIGVVGALVATGVWLIYQSINDMRGDE